MPILRRESDLYPGDLFSIEVGTMPWEILHLRSRQEKTVARLLTDHHEPFYLPQIEKEVKREGRIFRSFLPLFPGYVFIRHTESVREVLWRTRAVARLIRVEDQAQFHGELQQIRSLQLAGATLIPQIDLAPGDPVRIVSGVFSGYIGTVVRERDAVRLIVSITALNKSVVAELPREAVAPARHGARPGR
ncbi:MAG TPA: transcription termination/antitermination NusG family protein [Thermoanaerobaculia bacterium]|jgi:transcription antitermination factor NusG